jgi:membrane protease subunit HflK
VLTEYQKAPQVTRDRLYLESMQEIYGNVTKVLVDSKQGSNLLYLPLDKIMQLSGDETAPAPLMQGTAPGVPSTAPAPTVNDPRSRLNQRSRERETR